MIWLTWRQFRARGAFAVAALIGFTALLAATGPNLANLYAASSISSCQADCTAAADDFLQRLFGNLAYADSSLAGIGVYWLLFLFAIVTILVAPALIGMFWGAPIVAGEYEARTHYVAWNQSVTRTRWLAVKLALTALAAMALEEALSAIETWWATPISRAVAQGAVATPMAMNQFSPLVFATHGITPIGYAAFAFALGVLVGALVRRTVPAMALMLAIFAVLQIGMPLWVRPHLFPPVHSIAMLSSFGSVDVPVENGSFAVIPTGWDSQAEGWILSTGAVNEGGTPVSAIPPSCMQVASSAAGDKSSHLGLLDCLAANGIRVAVTYQPASRYWAFQWTEAAIFVAIALVLGAYCFWRINSRAS